MKKKKILPSSDSDARNQARRLVLLLLTLLANDVEELEGVLALVGGDDAEPVTELLLLEELLGQVLDVAAGELLVGDNLDAAVAEVGDVDALAEVAGEAVDLDALLQEGGEGGGVEDAVVHGLGGVDDELLGDLRVLPGALESAAAGSGVLRSLHHFVGIEVIWGRRLSRSRGRKEMGILRRPH